MSTSSDTPMVDVSDDPIIWGDQDFSFQRPTPNNSLDRNIRLQLLGDPTHFTQWENGEENLYCYWYGTTVTGESVRVRSANKLPQMYSLAPPGIKKSVLRRTGRLEAVRSQLQAKLDERESDRPWNKSVIVEIEVVRRFPMWDAHVKKELMYKYTLNKPSAVPALRSIISSGILEHLPVKCFNADIDFTWRCMIDQGFSMGSWIEIPAGCYQISKDRDRYAETGLDDDEMDLEDEKARNAIRGYKKRRMKTIVTRLDCDQTRTQLEINCDLADMHPVSAKDMTADERKHAPMRVLTTDIECEGREGVFPEPEHDAVICIGNIVNLFGAGEKLAADARAAGIKGGLNPKNKEDAKKLQGNSRKSAFTEGAYVLFHRGDLDPDGMPTDRECYSFGFETEAAMLEAYSSFLRWLRPEFVLSWNGHGFDFPFLMDRAKVLGVEESFCCSGDVDHPWTKKMSTFGNKAYGSRSGFEIIYPGVTFYDVMQIDMRESKRRSYGLNAVAKEVLGDKKDDMHFSEITPLFRGSAKDRARVFKYCLIDCARTFEIQWAQRYISSMLAISSVTGCSPFILMARGVTARSYLFICRTCEQRDYVVDWKPPKKRKREASEAEQEIKRLRKGSADELDGDADDDEQEEEDEKGYEGAHVFDTIPGYYELLITLDFASLYPSIMQAYNLCWSTYVPPERVHEFKESELYYNETTKCHFLTADVYEGIIPLIERETVEHRRQIKRLMALAEEENDFAMVDYYNALQIALKLLGNGLYGTTGTGHKGPNKLVAATVTSFGKMLILAAEEYALSILRDAKNPTPWGTFPNAFVAAGDTDSIMICLDKKNPLSIADALALGKWLAEKVTSNYPLQINLEFEKVYAPGLFLCKKRYAGVLHTKDTGYDRIDCKGLESKRRDNSLWEHQTVCAVQDEILIGGGFDAAIEAAKRQVTSIYKHEVPLRDLVITAQISRREEEYKTVTSRGAKRPKPAQVIANAEIKKREGAGAAFKTGERVEYVIVPGGPKAKKMDCVRFVKYAEKDGQYGDVPQYLERLCKSLSRLIDPIKGKGFVAKNIISGDHCRQRACNKQVGPISKFLTRTNVM